MARCPNTDCCALFALRAVREDGFYLCSNCKTVLGVVPTDLLARVDALEARVRQLDGRER